MVNSLVNIIWILSTFFSPQKQQQQQQQRQQQQPQPPNPPHLNAGSLLEVIRILDLPDPKRDFGFLALLMASQPGLPSQKKVPETPRNRKAL